MSAAPVTILLVRHGRTPWNVEGRIQGRTDIELDEQGRLDAVLAAELVRPHAPSRVVSSPLRRAAVTAQRIAEVLDLAPPAFDADLTEQGFGIAEGMLWPEFDERFPDGHVPGAESKLDLVARAHRTLQQHAAALDPGGALIAVSHGALINAVVKRACRRDLADYPGAAANGSVTRLTWNAAESFSFVERVAPLAEPA
ncbi:histidine phosphatase family protein [Leucobacter sp. HNU]|uniref:histidine phosphatase family protein n=1 Tax=Leucobacter sp. HNU TaxID=3236805 RepID=UPI003A8093FE